MLLQVINMEAETCYEENFFKITKKKFKIKKTFQNRKKVKIVKKISKSRKRFQNGKNFFLKLEKLFFKIGKTFSKSGNFIDITIFFFSNREKY